MISILMPVYNGVEFFFESYKSILSQTYENWELLIGINGHEENGEVFQTISNLVARSNRVKIYQFPKIKNKATTLNQLIASSNYEIICLLDVDDLWHSEKLAKQLQFIENYDIVGTDCRYFGDRRNKPGIPIGEIGKEIFLKVNPIINSSAMFRKKDAYWDDALLGLEDYDMWLRLNKEDRKFFNIGEELCYHRIHNSSYFNTKDFSNIESLLKNKWR